MKRWVFYGLSILLVASAAYVGWLDLKGKDSGAPPVAGHSDGRRASSANSEHAVKAIVAKSGSLPVLRNTIGTIVAVASTAVNSPETGNVAALNVKDGAIVKAGDLIAQLDDQAIRANLGKDAASVAKSQATLNDAEIQLKRTQDLVQKGSAHLRAVTMHWPR